MNKKIKIIIGIIVGLIICYGIIFLVDYNRVSNAKEPIFNINQYEETGLKEYKGLGYRTIAKYSYIDNQYCMTNIEMYVFNKCIAGAIIDYIDENMEIQNTKTNYPMSNAINDECFYGTVIESNSNSILLEPYGKGRKDGLTDRVSISLGKDNDMVFKIGTNVKITYDGTIMETYPTQVKAIKIELKSVDKFNLVFYQKTMIQPKQKEIIISKGELEKYNYNVYAYEGHIGIQLGDEEGIISLREALLQNKITMEEILEKVNKEIPNPISYDDGGSAEYHYDNYTIIKCHTLDGNRDVYFGTKEMKLNDVI